MILTLNRNDSHRRSTSIVYTGENVRGSIRVSKSLFRNREAPPSLTFESEHFAEPRTPYAKMTTDERRAWRKAQPTLTLEQKIAKQEQRLARMKAQVLNASQPVAV